MSRAETAARLTRAAIALGTARGVGALSLQAIANEAGVSKALLLYHFAGKTALLDAMVAALGSAGAERLRAAGGRPDAMAAWRALARDEVLAGEAALLAALGREAEVGPAPIAEARAARHAAAVTLAAAILAEVGLTPRVPPAFIGALLLRQLDGLAAAAPRGALPDAAFDAELDAFALALLAFGH